MSKMAAMGPLLLLLSCTLAAGRPAPGSRSLLDEASQTATAQLSGTTGGSIASAVAVQVSENGNLDVKGTASASAAGSGVTEATVETKGQVRQGEESAPFVANAAVGLVEAVGADVATAAEAWGSSGAESDGPRANAGHNVSAEGDLTGSAGDEAVAELSARP